MIIKKYNQNIGYNNIDITIKNKGVNTVPEAVPVWPAVRYILDNGQYRCTVLGLLLFFIFINK